MKTFMGMVLAIPLGIIASAVVFFVMMLLPEPAKLPQLGSLGLWLLFTGVSAIGLGRSEDWRSLWRRASLSYLLASFSVFCLSVASVALQINTPVPKTADQPGASMAGLALASLFGLGWLVFAAASLLAFLASRLCSKGSISSESQATH